MKVKMLQKMSCTNWSKRNKSFFFFSADVGLKSPFTPPWEQGSTQKSCQETKSDPIVQDICLALSDPAFIISLPLFSLSPVLTLSPGSVKVLLKTKRRIHTKRNIIMTKTIVMIK